MDCVNSAPSPTCAHGGAFPFVSGDTGGDAVSSSGCAVVLVRSDCLPVAYIRGATAGLQLAAVIAGCGNVTWPMLGLVALTLSCVLAQPYEPQNWSLFAAKWLVPFVLFHLAGLVFDDVTSLKRFETFALITLAYLSFTAIMSLAGIGSLIFPRYILDEGLGIHADRARGPLLQAVANGVTL